VGKTLLSSHNLYTLLQLTQQAREAILAGTFADFYHQTLEKLGEPVPEYPQVS
jgi:tRNA-guanine family transglycosylase